MATKLKFGLLLPHFGEYGSAERCIEGSKKAEEYGFDSVWVRDHLVFEPHGMEGDDNTHIEGLLILAAVAAVCKKADTRHRHGDLAPPSDSPGASHGRLSAPFATAR
jgi:hypothetical protein